MDFAHQCLRTMTFLLLLLLFIMSLRQSSRIDVRTMQTYHYSILSKDMERVSSDTCRLPRTHMLVVNEKHLG